MIEKVKEKRMQLIKLGEGTKLNAENRITTKTIPNEDIEILFKLIKKFKPTVIFEVGTWIGTSAMTMDMASNGAKIYTCDRNKAYVYDSPNVTYYNCKSDKFFKIMHNNKIKADLLFIDARIADNVKIIAKTTTPNFVFITHDYEEGKKGWANIRALEKFYKKLEVIIPDPKSTIAYVKVG